MADSIDFILYILLQFRWCFRGARYLTNFPFIILEATVGTYELRSYGGEQ